MSMIGDTLSGIRRVMMLDVEVERLKERLDKAEAAITEQDRRLVRIETLIEFGRPRLPRG